MAGPARHCASRRGPGLHVYVRNKLSGGCGRGFYADCTRLSADATLADVLAVVDRLNKSERTTASCAVAPEDDGCRRRAAGVRRHRRKDVDGFAAESGAAGTEPAAARGLHPGRRDRMLEREKIQIAGKRAVVLGRSDMVGSRWRSCCCTGTPPSRCAPRTPDLAATRRRRTFWWRPWGRLVTPDFVKPGATVVDVAPTKCAIRRWRACSSEGHPPRHARVEGHAARRRRASQRRSGGRR
jgi:methylenetetrahydrofolate dehydrogenase (NADP+)/methenyltetrahydrofolate cyclohydrolase